jgi:hypothetical protein
VLSVPARAGGAGAAPTAERLVARSAAGRFGDA